MSRGIQVSEFGAAVLYWLSHFAYIIRFSFNKLQESILYNDATHYSYEIIQSAYTCTILNLRFVAWNLPNEGVINLVPTRIAFIFSKCLNQRLGEYSVWGFWKGQRGVSKIEYLSFVSSLRLVMMMKSRAGREGRECEKEARTLAHRYIVHV